MTPRDKTTIDLAVHLLREAVVASNKAKVDTIPVRLALRVLLPHCPENWPLVSFWKTASWDDDIARPQNVSAAFKGIVRQSRKSGAWRADPRPTARRNRPNIYGILTTPDSAHRLSGALSRSLPTANRERLR